jgi:hypothetical protein
MAQERDQVIPSNQTVIRPLGQNQQNQPNQQFFDLRPNPEQLNPAQQQVEQEGPNFGDMARNFVLTVIPAIVVGIANTISTVAQLVGEVQAQLARQSQQQTNPQSNQSQPNQNLQSDNQSTQAQVTVVPTQVRQSPAENTVLETPNRIRSFQTETPNLETVMNRQELTPQMKLESVVWSTKTFGEQNEQGQSVHQIANHTCVLDPANKAFVILDESQKPVFMQQNGKTQGEIPDAVAIASLRQQKEFVDTAARTSGLEGKVKSQSLQTEHAR